MSVGTQKLVENIFFFVLFAGSAYLVWKLFTPFVGALALAAIVVTVCYPVHERIVRRTPGQNKTFGAFLSLFFVTIAIVTPLAVIASLIFREALSVYTIINSSERISFINSVTSIEALVQKVIPNFSLDIAEVIQQTANFVVSHFVGFFTATASTLFLFFIALIATFYFFRDGKVFTTYLIQLSPLQDDYDVQILSRLAIAVRSVALGTVFVAMMQGILTAIGLSLFGFDRAILWGCVAAIGALVPGVGTSIVFLPAIMYSLYVGHESTALFLFMWGALAVGLIDNFLGPYVMSRGHNTHPFLILLSVLGGISLFGPIGFILGPVILSLFLVLLQIYHARFKEIDDSYNS
jgi:predicted PurR-regulated permease PerM